jgi:hypothetical protein
MTPESLNAAIAATALLISLGTAWVSIGQWRVAATQLQLDRDHQLINNFVTLMQYMHTSEYRDARNTVCSKEFSGEDEAAIKIVCSHFDFAGLLVRKGFVDDTLFFEYWGGNLRTLSAQLRPFLSKEIHKGVTGYENWKDFAWLLRRMDTSPPGGEQSGQPEPPITRSLTS